MMEEITKQFWEASEKRLACRIQMKGEPLSRVVHPYGICQSSTNKIVLVCWQILGFTGSKGKPGYRNLVLADCESVEILDTHFRVDKDFKPKDSQYKDWVYHI